MSEDNTLAIKFPDIAKQWHPTKNELTPSDVKPGSNKKVWWKCTLRGHDWNDNVYHRTHEGRGCPFCSGHRVGDDNNLAVINPDLSKEWHPKNKLTPDKVTPGSHKKVWWMCEKGHEWEAVVKSRTSGRGCLQCYGSIRGEKSRRAALKRSGSLAENEKYSELVKEWHPKNELTPSDVTPGSDQKVWWICEKDNSHEWQSTIYHRTHGQGCLYCAESIRGENIHKAALRRTGSLAKSHPELTKEWHYTKNGELTPSEVTYGSIKRVWWMCEKGHEWDARVDSRARGSGCRYCHRERRHST